MLSTRLDMACNDIPALGAGVCIRGFSSAALPGSVSADLKLDAGELQKQVTSDSGNYVGVCCAHNRAIASPFSVQPK